MVIRILILELLYNNTNGIIFIINFISSCRAGLHNDGIGCGRLQDGGLDPGSHDAHEHHWRARYRHLFDGHLPPDVRQAECSDRPGGFFGGCRNCIIIIHIFSLFFYLLSDDIIRAHVIFSPSFVFFYYIKHRTRMT